MVKDMGTGSAKAGSLTSEGLAPKKNEHSTLIFIQISFHFHKKK